MKRKPFTPDTWIYALSAEWQVLAGKTDADNDLLSLKSAKPNELWFHAKGLPGSHVILRGPSGENPATELIRQAAAVAAWHSKARHGGQVPVNYTQAKHVSKPRGAKPGSVQIKCEKTIKVRPGLPATS